MKKIDNTDLNKVIKKQPEKKSGCKFIMQDYDKLLDEKMAFAITLMPFPEA